MRISFLLQLIFTTFSFVQCHVTTENNKQMVAGDIFPRRIQRQCAERPERTERR